MKSIISLPPVLQAVWTAVYAAGVNGELSRYSIDSATSTPSDESIAAWAENHAWEAVRRANGGEMPEGPRKTDDKIWKRSAMRKALLWFADEGHDVGLPRHQTGVEKAREALGIPCRYEDGSLMPLAEALSHGAAIGAAVEEPTDEEMIVALAPLAAEVCQALHASPDAQQRIVEACGASWKAARAWGKK